MGRAGVWTVIVCLAGCVADAPESHPVSTGASTPAASNAGSNASAVADPGPPAPAVGTTPVPGPHAVTPPPSVGTVDFTKPVLYWTENSFVRASSLDGTASRTIAVGEYPTGVAIDAVAGQLYWADNETDSITRANLDGSDAKVIYTSSDTFANPNGIAIDHAANRIFWTEASTPTNANGYVKSAALDGSGATALYTGQFPTGVALSAPFLYFTDNGTDTVTQGRYDGSAATVLYTDSDRFSNPSSVIVAGSRVFWGEAGGVYGMNTDGTGAGKILAGGYPDGIALDPTGPYLFVADNEGDTITRVGYDGSAPTVVYRNADAFSNPRGVAVSPGFGTPTP